MVQTQDTSSLLLTRIVLHVLVWICMDMSSTRCWMCWTGTVHWIVLLSSSSQNCMKTLVWDWNLHFMYLEPFINDTGLATWCIIILTLLMNCSHEKINLAIDEVDIHCALQMFSRCYERWSDVPGRTLCIFVSWAKLALPCETWICPTQVSFPLISSLALT